MLYRSFLDTKGKSKGISSDIAIAIAPNDRLMPALSWYMPVSEYKFIV